MATQSSRPASAASMMESAAKGGGTRTDARRGIGLADRLLHRVSKTGNAVHALAASARRHPADHVGPVVDHLLGVKAGDAAGDALDDDRRRPVHEDAHDTTLMVCGRLLLPGRHRAVGGFRPGSRRG